MAMANSDDPRQEPRQPTHRRHSAGSSRDEQHGFTEDWVRNHASRVAQRQIEVHDVPSGTPRTQIHQEVEERK